MVGAPQHTIADLIARLDEVGCCVLIHESLQALLSIIIHAREELCLVQVGPRRRYPLVRGVCPAVGVLDIQQHGEALSLQALAEADHIIQVLTHLHIGVAVVIHPLGIHEQANAGGVPPHFDASQILHHIVDALVLEVIVLNAMILVALQQGQVASNVHLLCAERHSQPAYHSEQGQNSKQFLHFDWNISISSSKRCTIS